MRKKIRGMLIGTLVMAAVCLICALLEITSAVTYISMIGPGSGASTADMILYVVNEAFAPVGALFILLSVACVEYILMHLGKKPEKKGSKEQSPKAARRLPGRKKRPAEEDGEMERPEQRQERPPQPVQDSPAEFPPKTKRPSGTKFPVNMKQQNKGSKGEH